MHLVYAFPGQHISFTHLNLGGPEPLTYLEYARRDVADSTQQGAINALGHAKRAIHLAIDKMLKAYCLEEWAKAPFPVRAEILRDIGAFPTRLVSGLNRARNLMEHDYGFVEIDRAADFVELAKLFLAAAYPFFRRGTIGAYVGIENETQCTEWFVDREAKVIAVADIAADSYLELPVGRVHYNMRRPREATSPRFVVPLTRSRQSDWMPYLDLFVYCTRRETLRLAQPDHRGPGIYYHQQELHFPPETEDDGE